MEHIRTVTFDVPEKSLPVKDFAMSEDKLSRMFVKLPPVTEVKRADGLYTIEKTGNTLSVYWQEKGIFLKELLKTMSFDVPEKPLPTKGKAAKQVSIQVKQKAEQIEDTPQKWTLGVLLHQANPKSVK
jgi:hypothetical protein